MELIAQSGSVQFQTISRLKPLDRLIIFHVQFPWPAGTKYYSNGLNHMTNMAAMPKTHGKNLVYQDQKTDGLETCIAFGTRVLP